MTRPDFRSPRLYVDAPLTCGAVAPLSRDQTHYLANVLRLADGAPVLAFNGRDGEWRTALVLGKKTASLVAGSQTRPQTVPSRIHYVFAPLKHARLDYMVQKATEMGASALVPVMTRHTQVSRINGERMRANAIEAAEQCGILSVPEVAEATSLDAFLDARDRARLLIFCDEDAPIADPLKALADTPATLPGLDILVGPEGGFSEDERAILLREPQVIRLSLGPRILRADTAAVAALAIVQAAAGDWK